MKKFQITNSKSQFTFITKGFTLIELLIVIVIIGILSTLVIANFVGVRARARDAERKTDLAQIRTALQLYYSDNGSYPAWSGSSGSSAPPQCGQPFIGGTVTYIQKMPCDPKTATERYTYTALPTGCGLSSPCTAYTLRACLENTADSDRDVNNGGSNTCTGNTTSYTVRNP